MREGEVRERGERGIGEREGEGERGARLRRHRSRGRHWGHFKLGAIVYSAHAVTRVAGHVKTTTE